MKVFSATEVAEWFKGFDNIGVESDYVHADEDGLFFTHPEASCISLEYPAKLERFPFFARYVASIGHEEQHFDGAILWVQHWGVWNLFGEGIGYRIVEKMNAAAVNRHRLKLLRGIDLRGHPNPANEGHLKTGQR